MSLVVGLRERMINIFQYDITYTLGINFALMKREIERNIHNTKCKLVLSTKY